MRRTAWTTPVVVVATLVPALLLGGCGTEQLAEPRAGGGAAPGDVVSTELPPYTPDEVPPIPEPRIVYRDGELKVTAMGSSTCRPIAVDVEVRDASTLVVETKQWGDQACTDDYGPTVSTIEAPGGIDWSGDVTGYIRTYGRLGQAIEVVISS